MIETAELRWYFSQAAGELGFRSSFGSMQVTLQIGAASSTPTISEPNATRIAAARRDIRIRRAMRDVPPRLQSVLEAAFSPRRYPTQLLTLLGPELTGVVVRLMRRGDSAISASTKNEARLAQIRAEAAALLSEAVSAYGSARARQRAAERR